MGRSAEFTHGAQHQGPVDMHCDACGGIVGDMLSPADYQDTADIHRAVTGHRVRPVASPPSPMRPY